MDSLGLKAKYAAYRRRNISSLINNAKRLCSSPKVRPDSLLTLPTDILYLVFPHLPLLSQVCLALSCNWLYRIFGHVLQHESLAWPKMTRNPELPLALNQLDHPRNQLLFLLEDDCWLYCAGCLKLHPRSRFNELPAHPVNRKCVYKTGIVDLCSCLSLTMFDRIRLEKSILKGRMDPSLPRAIRDALQLTGSRKQRRLVHRCSIDDQEDAHITLAMTIALEYDSIFRLYEMVVHSRYSTHLRKPVSLRGSEHWNWRRLAMKPVLICPHTDLSTLFPSEESPEVPRYRKCLCYESITVEGTPDGLCVTAQCQRPLGGKVDFYNPNVDPTWHWNVRRNGRWYRVNYDPFSIDLI